MSDKNRTGEGADWAMWDPETANQYGGNWVVAVPHEVIEYGTDPLAVRDRAAAKLGLPPDEVVVCAVATLESRVPFGW
jgi:hypothetical protein